MDKIIKRKVDFTNEDSIMLRHAMSVICDYLNDVDRQERKDASIKAKELYREYYGVDFINRNER